MRRAKQLTKKQLAVIEELFAGELDEQAILDKYKLSRKLYHRWRNDENFTEQFEKRISDSYLQSDVLIARYAPVAAAKLIQLTSSDKPETARKACLDIISNLIGSKKAKPQEIIGLMAWHLRRLLAGKGIRRKSERKALIGNIRALLLADYQIKRSRLDPRFILEFTILRLCA